MQTILLTGSLGFIGNNFVRRIVPKCPEYRFVGVDKAVFSYNLNNQFKHDNYSFYLADISDAHTMNRIFEIERPDIVIGMAAESFVDNAITDISPFIHTNIIGTQTLVNACLKYEIKQYIHISTDEVYGQQLDIDNQGWTENDPIQPRNPYAATKACAELIVRTAHHTHGLQFKMTRSCNVYGPRQKHENLVPMIINNLLDDRPITIHGNGLNFRQYIHVNDKIDAVMQLLRSGKLNQVYNIGDSNFKRNIEMVNYIAKAMHLKPYIQYITDRKAHDYGYKVNYNKMAELGWKPQVDFNSGMLDTILFYKGLRT